MPQNEYSATEQPDPVKNETPAVWDLVITDIKFIAHNNPNLQLVIKDMTDRDQWGELKYKTRLQPFNGRDALVDFYQELLDSSVYFRQHLYEVGTPSQEDLEKYHVVLDLIQTYRTRIFERDGK